MAGLILDAGTLIRRRCPTRTAGSRWPILKEPYRVEGKKTMGYELWEQFGDLGAGLDVISTPPAAAPGLIGMWKALAM